MATKSACKKYFKNPAMYFRILEVIFSIVAFASAASLKNQVWGYISQVDTTQTVAVDYENYPSYVAFMIFTGVSGFLISLIYLILYGFTRVQGPKLIFSEVVINFIWLVFFVAAAGSMAANLDSQCGTFTSTSISGAISGDRTTTSDWCNAYKASVVFGFLACGAYTISFVISLIHMLKPNRSPYYSPAKTSVQMGQV